MLRLLRERGCHRIFVEGGGVTVSMFLEADLLDRLQMAIAPLIIGDGRPAIRLPARDALSDCRRPRYRVFRMGGDVFFDCDLRDLGEGPEAGRSQCRWSPASSEALRSIVEQPAADIVVPDDAFVDPRHRRVPAAAACQRVDAIAVSAGDISVAATAQPAISSRCSALSRSTKQPVTAAPAAPRIPLRATAPPRIGPASGPSAGPKPLSVRWWLLTRFTHEAIVLVGRRAGDAAVVVQDHEHRRRGAAAMLHEVPQPLLRHEIEKRRSGHQVAINE